jgi:hypothetical protein
MADGLEAALKDRLRAVLDGQSCTEADLRKLFEEGRACERILRTKLEHVERELDALDADPGSSIAELAEAVREAGALRPRLDDLDDLLYRLERRARKFRAAWLSGG